MDKDKSIITQVSAKIACDLTDKSLTTEQKVDEFGLLFEAITDIMFTKIYGDMTIEEQAVTNVISAFDGATELTVKVRGTQHGPLPEWLLAACKRDGVTEVYDNRDSLAQNPKRPWFKAVNDKDKAYWAPKK